MATTDENGIATFRLTAAGATIGPVECFATLSNKSERLTPVNAAWQVTPSKSHLLIEHEVITGNRNTNGVISVDTLNDSSESLHPLGGAENDYTLNVPVFHESTITIVDGEPNHTYTVNLHSSSQSVGQNALASKYSFENIEELEHEIDGVDYAYVSPSEDQQHVAHIMFPNNIIGALCNGIPVPPNQQCDIIPHGNKKLQINVSAEDAQDTLVRFDDPAALAFYSDVDTRLSFYFAPSNGHSSDDSTEILSKGDLSIFYNYNSTTNQCSFTVNFPTSEGLQTLTTESFDFTVGRWYRVKMDALSNKILFQVTEAHTYGKVAQEALNRDAEGYIQGYTDGKVYNFDTNETIIEQDDCVIMSCPYLSEVDYVEFNKFVSQSASSVMLTGLVGSTITTDANGSATFKVKSKGTMPSTTVDCETINIEVTGSETLKASIYSTTDWLYARLIECGKATLKGSDGLGDGAAWYEKAAAWASECIPFVSDLRTIGFEIYKGATGCDKVDWLNVSFSVAGLVLDCCTFGGAKLVTGPLKVAGLAAAKALLKNIVIGVTMSAVIDSSLNALNGYIKRINEDAASDTADSDTWVTNSANYLNFVNTTAQSNQQELAENIFGAMGSVNDVMDMATLHHEMDADFEEYFTPLPEY